QDSVKSKDVAAFAAAEELQPAAQPIHGAANGVAEGLAAVQSSGDVGSAPTLESEERLAESSNADTTAASGDVKAAE
ncbi:unnamed protein product, partial [Chrysoparadoxa australica]